MQLHNLKVILDHYVFELLLLFGVSVSNLSINTSTILRESESFLHVCKS